MNTVKIIFELADGIGIRIEKIKVNNCCNNAEMNDRITLESIQKCKTRGQLHTYENHFILDLWPINI